MKITVDSKEFVDAIKNAEKVMPKKSSLPLLQNIFIVADHTGIKIVSNDYDLTLIINISGDVFEPGITSFPAQTAKTVKAIKTNLPITITRNDIQFGSNTIKLIYNPADAEILDSLNIIDYLNAESAFSINSSELLKIKHCLGKDITRPIFTGFLIDNNKLVSTDSYRMVINTLSEDTKQNIIIPGYILELIAKTQSKKDNNNFAVSFHKKRVILTNCTKTFITRTIEGQYPKYNEVIPEYSDYIQFNRKSLIDILENMKPFTKAKKKIIPIVLDIDNDLTVSINNESGIITNSLPIVHHGEKITIGININYFLDLLNAYNTEEIKLYYGNKLSPLLVDQENLINIVFPVRLKA